MPSLAVIIAVSATLVIFKIADKLRPFKITDSQVSKSLDTDVVFYPFSFNVFDDYVKGFAFKGNKTVELKRELNTGVSSAVSLEVLTPLYSKLSVSTYDELTDVLGQYFFQRSYEDAEILLFFDWYKAPHTLNLVIIKNGEIKIISEVIENSDLLPFAVMRQGDDLLIKLDDSERAVELRKVSLNDYSVQKYSFNLDGLSSKVLYPVDIVFNNNNLYFMLREIDNGVTTGTYIITYNLISSTMQHDKIIEHVEFMCSDNESLYYGYLKSPTELAVVKQSFNDGSRQTGFVPLPGGVTAVHANSTLCKDGRLYIAFDCKPTKQRAHGYFCMIDLAESKILNQYSYEYDGGLYIRYYQPNSNYLIDEEFISGY